LTLSENPANKALLRMFCYMGWMSPLLNDRCYFFAAGSKQKWVPINIELPKTGRGRKNWQAARRDQLQESGEEAGQSSKADTTHFRQRDVGQATAHKNDISPRKDRKDRRDVVDRGGKDHGRPSSAFTKAPNKKGKFRTPAVSSSIYC